MLHQFMCTSCAMELVPTPLVPDAGRSGRKLIAHRLYREVPGKRPGTPLLDQAGPNKRDPCVSPSSGSSLSNSCASTNARRDMLTNYMRKHVLFGEVLIYKPSQNPLSPRARFAQQGLLRARGRPFQGLRGCVFH